MKQTKCTSQQSKVGFLARELSCDNGHNRVYWQEYSNATACIHRIYSYYLGCS